MRVSASIEIDESYLRIGLKSDVSKRLVFENSEGKSLKIEERVC